MATQDIPGNLAHSPQAVAEKANFQSGWAESLALHHVGWRILDLKPRDSFHLSLELAVSKPQDSLFGCVGGDRGDSDMSVSAALPQHLAICLKSNKLLNF